MARVELPESRLKARKRRRLLRILLSLFVLTVLFAGSLAGLSHIPATLVSTVSVSGTQTLAPAAIRAHVEERIAGSYAFILPKRNIFIYPKKEIAASLGAKYPLLASVDVHAADFHTLAVVVVEREPRALWCPAPSSGQTTCYFMDENGVVYADAPTFSEPVYVSYFGEASAAGLPKQYLAASGFQSLAALVDAIDVYLEEQKVLSVEVDAEQDVRVRFVSGFMLLFSLADAPGDIFDRLTLSLKAEPLTTHALSEFEYLDLRFGDKLYYKLKQ